MTTNDFLIQHAPGFSELAQEEIEAINNFSLLWSLFEAQVLNTSASANKIISKTNDWSQENRIHGLNLEPFTAYFRDRYVENGELNSRFNHLHFRPNDNQDLVENVLLEQTEEPEAVLSACLIIVLRFRNNFFHGIKWAYEMKDQKSNFEISSHLLKECIGIQSSL